MNMNPMWMVIGGPGLGLMYGNLDRQRDERAAKSEKKKKKPTEPSNRKYIKPSRENGHGKA